MDLQEIMNKQLELQKTHFPQILEEPAEKQILRHTNALVHEVIETERELNYKYWKQPVEIDWGKVHEEMVDQFIFFINQCNAAGLSATRLFNLTLTKQGVNRKRQNDGY